MSRRDRALVGVVSAVAGLSAAQLAGAFTHQRTGPVAAVAEAVRDLTPGAIAHFFISLVGTLDKPLLSGLIVVVTLALAAWAGISRWGTAIFVVLGALAGAAAATRPAAGSFDALPALLGAAASVIALSALQPKAPAHADPQRRLLLRNLALVVGGSLVAAGGGTWLSHPRQAVQDARAALRLKAGKGAVPDGASIDGVGLGPWRVSNEEFYRIDTAFSVPAIDPADWQLRIHGLVEREIRLNYADLLDRQRSEAWITLCCVSNPVGGSLIGNAYWSGIRIADLLAEAKPAAEADMVLQTSQDGWTCGTPLSALTDDRDALLAVAMNGEPLPLEHGFPVRAVVPGLYGYVSATKWVIDFEVTRFDRARGYWTPRGWSALGPVKTQSRIDVPRGDVEAGSVQVAGVAWAQHTGVKSVEIRLDDGTWQSCDLGRVPSTDTWVQWATTVTCERGDHTIDVRATDRPGRRQTSQVSDVAPDGATGWHRVEFTAR